MNQIKNNQEKAVITYMRWYHYLAAFGAGFFLANAVPHFASGAIGSEFPSPFGNPPGVGLSSPLTNMVWGLINLVLGYLTLRGSKVQFRNSKAMSVLFLGIVCCGLMLSIIFGGNPNL